MLARLQKEKVLSAQQLKSSVSSRMALKRLVEDGKIVSLGAGLYASSRIDPFVASVIAIPRFYPKAILSNITALVIHGLSDESVDRIDVDIPRDSSIRNALLRVHRVPAKRLVGITAMKFHGEIITIYDPERSLAEAFRFDKGGPIFYKALKRYLRQHDPNMALILKYDGLLGTLVMPHVQQELADV